MIKNFDPHKYIVYDTKINQYIRLNKKKEYYDNILKKDK